MAVIVEKVLVVVTFLLCLFLNALAARGDLSGTTIGEVSNKYPTYVTPDNITFAVWGVTYLLQLLLVVAQIATTESTEKLLSQPCCMTTLSVRWRLVMIFLLNALWLPLYANLLFGKSMLVICVYLALLISVYLDVNTRTTQSFWEWVMYGSGIACNVSWVLVAAVANKLTLAASMGGWADASLGFLRAVLRSSTQSRYLRLLRMVLKAKTNCPSAEIVGGQEWSRWVCVVCGACGGHPLGCGDYDGLRGQRFCVVAGHGVLKWSVSGVGIKFRN